MNIVNANDNNNLITKKLGTIGSDPKKQDEGTTDRVQYEPLAVWSRRPEDTSNSANCVYLLGGTDTKYVRCGKWWQVWCWTRVRYERTDAYSKITNHAKSLERMGFKYGIWSGQLVCSQLAYICYNVGGINISTWYEAIPSPESIFRDDETIIIDSAYLPIY